MFSMRFLGRLAILAGALLAMPANAAINLVQNGGFEQTTLAGSYGFGDRYAINQVADWETAGYSFVFAPGEQDTVGAEGERGHLWLWGPRGLDNAGSANGMPAASPAGGNFIAADGAYETSPISQLVTGLVVGQDYTLSFLWAAAEQRGYNGVTQQNWTYSLDGQAFTTATVTNPDHGFTPWRKVSHTFTASSSTELLSFLAKGTPTGKPPFALLDGVSLTANIAAVPEPASWALMIVGFGAIGYAMRRRNATETAR